MGLLKFMNYEETNIRAFQIDGLEVILLTIVHDDDELNNLKDLEIYYEEVDMPIDNMAYEEVEEDDEEVEEDDDEAEHTKDGKDDEEDFYMEDDNGGSGGDGSENDDDNDEDT
ncbi:uncharacterized protein LOC129289131 [Prosopis cineraria]|uniref:uncharacterized protein LOC129289131 n=1 Tax=Prosopis cineraria TaxID=364024 RepID=UPI00240F04F3|nr:uncharacterized protein LOC129289131 [Prosopis cineraria]